MEVRLSYVFEAKDGFRYTRENPEEIKEIVKANYDALKRIVADGDTLDMVMDYTNEYLPKATITACIRGTWVRYELRTEITPIQ